jgi:hypothetical protein
MIAADSERNLEGFSPSPLFSVSLTGKMGWGRKNPSILEKDGRRVRTVLSFGAGICVMGSGFV